MSERRAPHGRRLGLTLVAGLTFLPPAHAENNVTILQIPPEPSLREIEQAARETGNPLSKPVTGAKQIPAITGGERPPSLEALQAALPGPQPGDGLEPGRGDILYQAALTFGAQGGLAARAFGINEMLRRYEPTLDSVFDFRTVVVRVGPGRTLMRPPIVTAAQMAFALGEGAQVARETACVYQITRRAQLASAPPNWRTYLVRSWASPSKPSDAVLPRTEQEVNWWKKWVAEGWAQGERQGVEIFLADLSRLQRDYIGMVRYRVLLRAGLVENPRVAFEDSLVNGGHEEMRAGDRVIRITDQPGLRADRKSWPKNTRDCPQ
ncbi:type IV secretion system DotC family protein [Beijerinckia indica]|uniref:DotC n=1 Tax=Beijerinckia indica subsp. indica (strain ATCC 9039 / DSM 1715 / NCIMB 8712) TaxID=395963 RepID=B2IL30_BEII9|nr:type IV secretion system DotC family protein [Beijerinckia indica]ACB97230.1 DotC [Beijerinckia indica subsp. indica ATCC 9039]